MAEKKFEYVDVLGNKKDIVLKPLPVKYLGDFYTIVNHFSSVKFDDSASDEEKSKAFLAQLTKDKVDTLVVLCMAVVKKSTGMKEEECEDFVSTHFLELFPAVIESSLQKK